MLASNITLSMVLYQSGISNFQMLYVTLSYARLKSIQEESLLHLKMTLLQILNLFESRLILEKLRILLFYLQS